MRIVTDSCLDGGYLREVKTSVNSEYYARSYSQGVISNIKKGEDWISLIEKTDKKYVLVSLPPGFGKSYSIGTLKREGTIIYCSQQPARPATSTLVGWDRFPTRHTEKIVSETEALPDGSPVIEYSRKKIENPTGNCKFAWVHVNAMTSRLGESICKKCPLHTQCVNGRGDGYGFINEVRATIKQQRYRAHFKTLTKLPKDCTLIIDEVKASANPVETVSLDWKVFERLSFYLDKIGLLEVYSTFKEILLSLKSLARKTYGGNHEEMLRILDRIKPILMQHKETLLAEENNHIDELFRQTFRGRIKTIPTRWLDLIYRVFAGEIRLSCTTKQMMFTMVNEQARELVKSSKQTIFLDGTLSVQELSLMYDIPVDEILVISSEAKTDNVLVEIYDIGFEITNRLDLVKSTKVELLRDELQEQGVGIITWKSLADASSLTLLATSRGSNEFQTKQVVAMLGLPRIALSAAEAEYIVLGGDKKGFKLYYENLLVSEIRQAIGRLRAEQRETDLLTFKIYAKLSPKTLPEYLCIRR
jgi:hypothetical protein